MPPHERNPICVSDMNHLTEMLKFRFDASDKIQKEMLEQAKLTNGRTRKLEDSHIEQINFNRAQFEMNEVFMKHIIAQKEKNSNLAVFAWSGKNWKELTALAVTVFGIWAAVHFNDNKPNEYDSKHKQTNTSQGRTADSFSYGSTNCN